MAVTERPTIAPQAVALVGRDAEQKVLRQTLSAPEPLVVFVHGIGGIGKSALLDAFAIEARAAGTTVLALDGGSIEPTIRGFLAALSIAAGEPLAGAEAASTRLAALGPAVILAIDRYEVLRPIDPWLRQTFVPGLTDTVRLILAGRDRPTAAWGLEMGRLFRSLPLANLEREDALRLLQLDGVAGDDLQRIQRLARGHPLSLRLAASALGGEPVVDPDRTTMTAIVAELTRLYLEQLDPATRQALDAASVVRRPTMSLLTAMLPDAAPRDLFDRLLRLPFVHLGDDGLVVHDTIRETVAAYLRATDPGRSRRYRIAAWRRLRDEVARSPRQAMRRYPADLLYILENATMREAYFPTTVQRFVVDAAGPDDLEAVLELSRRQYPDESPALINEWWKRAPWAFRMARDDTGAGVGFSVLAELERLPRRLVDADPVARRWSDHLHEQPIPRGQRCLVYRFERADPSDPAATAIHAACFLDLFRATMELRPELRRRYQASQQVFGPTDVETFLGLERITASPIQIPNAAPRHAYCLDFGPGSVDAWLSRLIATELEVEQDAILDLVRRQLVLGERRIDLTRLEFALIGHLHEQAGTVVPRATLLRDVWGYEDDGGSNVIESIVRSLRRKLGDRAGAIETVRGVGYRFVAPS